jgi:hypothetical protein
MFSNLSSANHVKYHSPEWKVAIQEESGYDLLSAERNCQRIGRSGANRQLRRNTRAANQTGSPPERGDGPGGYMPARHPGKTRRTAPASLRSTGWEPTIEEAGRPCRTA